MKILWITNTLFPQACDELKVPRPFVGGWMYSMAEAILKQDSSINLAVACLYNVSQLEIIKKNKITYYIIPSLGGHNSIPEYLKIYWKQIHDIFEPDLVHIHGSEYSHVLSYINTYRSKNIVISIQGLVSDFEKYFYGDISILDIFKNITLRDIIRNDSLIKQKYNMWKRGKNEVLAISQINNVIGRTNYDKAHVCSINPKVKYYFNNEILRDSFYERYWSLSECRRHSIFLSQVHTPIKGFHKMIKALPLILSKYPDCKIIVAGVDIYSKPFWRINGYERYIMSLLSRLNLKSKIHFIGPLDEREMVKSYLSSHVFVCPSSIENSSNSISEAQLLGVPCVASYVGGVNDLIEDGKTGFLYRFEDVEMLAKIICDIFSNDDLAISVSKRSNYIAKNRHSVNINSNALVDIYNKIINSN